MSKNVVCRGSWLLGSACGQCNRCCDQLLNLIECIRHQSECSLDHHGYCQEHGWINDEMCPHKMANIIFDSLAKKKRQTD